MSVHIARLLPVLAAASALIVVIASDSTAEEAAPEDRPATSAHAAHTETQHDTGHSDAAHSDVGHSEEHGGTAHAGRNFDDVPLIFEPALAFWSLGLFLVFLFVARRYAWAPLIAGLDAREARVNRALHDAEAARVEAEKLLAEHAARMEEVQEQVREIVAAARREAEAEKARIIAEADAEAATMRDRAIADIREAHRLALEALQSQIDRQADLAAEHILGVGR